MIKFFMWACYNSYVLYHAQQKKSNPEYFTRYIQSVCLELAGNFRTTAIRRGHQEPTPQRLTQGNHFPEIPPGSSSDHVCAVCTEKHNRYNRQHPGVAYKDNPFKKVKSRFRCALCKKHLCIKEGSSCWADWHTKAEYWR